MHSVCPRDLVLHQFAIGNILSRGDPSSVIWKSITYLCYFIFEIIQIYKNKKPSYTVYLVGLSNEQSGNHNKLVKAKKKRSALRGCPSQLP